jgi:hypothetical protein
MQNKSNLSFAVVLHGLEHHGAELGGGLDDVGARGLQGLELGSSGSFAAGYDGTSVTHASSRRSTGTGDETDDRLVAVAELLEPLGGVLLGLATDLSDHDDALRLRVIGEALQAVDEVGAIERISSDADASGLSKTNISGLGNSLVSQGSGSRDNSDLSSLVDVSGHNTNLALLGLNNTRAIGSDESTLGLLTQQVLHLL